MFKRFWLNLVALCNATVTFGHTGVYHLAIEFILQSRRALGRVRGADEFRLAHHIVEGMQDRYGQRRGCVMAIVAQFTNDCVFCHRWLGFGYMCQRHDDELMMLDTDLDKLFWA